jgi:hypothetical protein
VSKAFHLEKEQTMFRISLRKSLAVLTLIVVMISLLSSGPKTQTVQASSHREAPLSKLDPTADNTDVYAFRSTEAGRTGFVTLIANFIPFEEPAGGPHFYRFDDSATYNIKIDNDGDGVEDITFEFVFKTTFVNPNSILGQAAPNQATGVPSANIPAGSGGVDPLITSLTDPDYNEPQTYTVRMVKGASSKGGKKKNFTDLGGSFTVPPDNIGERTTPNYETALAQPAIGTLNFAGGLTGRVFAGQRDEGFYVNLEDLFDTINLASIGSTGGTDTTAGFNVHTIAIEVPVQMLTRNSAAPTDPMDANAVIGVWSTVDRGTLNDKGRQVGPFTQVSRLGSPLVNEVVIPLGTKDAFNASTPKNDSSAAPFVLDPQLPKLIQAVLAAGGVNINIPAAPRNDLAAIFATGIPAGLVPGFQNFLSDGTPHEYLRLNVAIPPSAVENRLGLLGNDPAGFPNGRRVGDDVVDIELRAVLGGTPFNPNNPASGTANPFNVAPNNTIGDGVDSNDVPYLTRFPYLGTPHPGNVNGNGEPHAHHVAH